MGIETIHEALDGRQAVDVLAQHACDLLVSDYHMPGLDGPALVRHLRSDPRFQHLPVLMITSETEPSVLAVAHKAGVSAICSKVFDPRTICSILGKILAPHRSAK
jgi:two-component system chemotaxis response regulator CheY